MSTIKSSREIDAIFREATRAAHQDLIALVRRTPSGRGPEGRVVFIAGKKIGGAVTRNRSKRVMRESVRRVGGPWSGYDVALMSRASTGQCSTDELDRELRAALRKAGVLS